MSEYIIVFGERFNDIIYWTFYELGYNGTLMNVHQFSNKKYYPLNLGQLEISHFEKNKIWLDIPTIEYNIEEESLKWIESVRPNKRNDDLIARYAESKGHSEYYENCYAYTVFKNRNSTFKGYVYLDADYRYWQGIEFEKHMRPAIISDDGIHITLEVRHQSQIAELYSLFDNNPQELFPLEFEIQANLKGFPKRGQLPGFIYGKEFIK